MKIYLCDGRCGEVDYKERVLIALHSVATANRLGLPIQVKIDGHFELVAVVSIDMARTLDQPKTIAGWEGYQLMLPKVLP